MKPLKSSDHKLHPIFLLPPWLEESLEVVRVWKEIEMV